MFYQGTILNYWATWIMLERPDWVRQTTHPVYFPFHLAKTRPPYLSTRFKLVCPRVLLEGSLEIANGCDLQQIDPEKRCNGAVALVLVDMAIFM